MNNYDLEQLYIHKVAGSKIVSEAANNPFGTSPYGVGSRIKRALNPFMSKTAKRSEAHSQQGMNDMYDKFVAALAKVGKREGQATAGDLTAYLRDLNTVLATAKKSKTWETLSLNPTAILKGSLAATFKTIVEEINQFNLTAKKIKPRVVKQTPPTADLLVTEVDFQDYIITKIGITDTIQVAQLIDLVKKTGGKFKIPTTSRPAPVPPGPAPVPAPGPPVPAPTP